MGTEKETANEPEPSVPAFSAPANGQEVCRTGNFDFEINPNECQWDISEFSKNLEVTLAARLQPAAPAIKAQLLDDHQADGQVKLSFEAHSIYQAEASGAEAMLEDSEFLEDDLYMVFEEALSEKNEADYKVNSYGFSQHQYPEYEASLTLRGNPEDWVILLEVASRGDFQWGDAGDLFFVIHKSDLIKRDFSNVFCTMYSS